MAKPRIFISSTYYDLKHLRSSIENFVEQLGYEPILSEKDVIAFTPDAPLDESCYREAKGSDVYVLIVGGRYGSEVSANRKSNHGKHDFYERYESVTKKEYLSVIEKGIPIYICIDASVDAEFQTFTKNRESTKVNYAHVDSVNVFHLIEFIRDQQKNNPIKLFSRYSEIEDWLREQWAGLFRELIHRLTQQKQIADINSRIGDLMQTSETLKRYLEDVVAKVSKGSDKTEAEELIRRENARLKEALAESQFAAVGYISHLERVHDVDKDEAKVILKDSSSYSDFVNAAFGGEIPGCCSGLRAFEEINEARRLLNLKEYPKEDLAPIKKLADIKRSKRVAVKIKKKEGA